MGSRAYRAVLVGRFPVLRRGNGALDKVGVGRERQDGSEPVGQLQAAEDAGLRRGDAEEAGGGRGGTVRDRQFPWAAWKERIAHFLLEHGDLVAALNVATGHQAALLEQSHPTQRWM